MRWELWAVRWELWDGSCETGTASSWIPRALISKLLSRSNSGSFSKLTILSRSYYTHYFRQRKPTLHLLKLLVPEYIKVCSVQALPKITCSELPNRGFLRSTFVWTRLVTLSRCYCLWCKEMHFNSQCYPFSSFHLPCSEFTPSGGYFAYALGARRTGVVSEVL